MMRFKKKLSLDMTKIAVRNTRMVTVDSTTSGTSNIGCQVPLWGRSGRDLDHRSFGLELYADGGSREMKVPTLGTW